MIQAIGAPAFVEAEQGAVGQGRQVAIAAEPGLKCAAGGPGFSLVITQPDGDVDPIAAQPRRTPAVPPPQIVGVRKSNHPRLIVLWLPDPDNARHADRFDQGFIEPGPRPATCSVGADGDQPTVPGRLAAAVEHHPAIGQLHDDRLVWIDPLGGVRDCNLAPVPGFAVVIAIDGRRHRRPMGVATCTQRQPDRHHQPAPMGAVSQLDAVGRTGCQHLPVIVAAKVVKRLGDLNWLGPGRGVVVAPHGETPHVFEAVEKMHRPGFVVDNGNRVVDGVVTGLVELLSNSNRVDWQLTFDMDDLLPRLPGLAAIDAPPQHHINRSPVAAGAAAGFAIREHGSCFGDHDAGNPVEGITVLTGFKEIGLGQASWGSRRSGRTANSEQQHEALEDQAVESAMSE